MINLLSSGVANPHSDFDQPTERTSGQDNVGWIQDRMKGATDKRKKAATDDKTKAPGEPTTLVMVGGKTSVSFRLRLAQSHVRSDMMPSYWSHVFMLDKPAKKFGTTTIYEISLEPGNGFGFPVPENGVHEGNLSQYADPEEYPNIALINVPVKLSDVKESLDRFKMQRAVLDGPDLIVNWLAYLWGVARSPNPLLDGKGIPSSAMLEVVIGACGFDLTPGLESRSSCPEAIWQAAKWWHEYYTKQGKDGLLGAFYSPHKIQ